MLFRLETNPDCAQEDKVLGHDWIEVLAVLPCSIQRGDGGEIKDYFSILSNLVCRTDSGIQFVFDSDLQAAVDAGEYNLSDPPSKATG